MEDVQHYPPPQLIRAVAEGRQPMPEDPVLRASVQRLVSRYRVKKAGDGGVDAKADVNKKHTDLPDQHPRRPQSARALNPGHEELFYKLRIRSAKARQIRL